MGIIFTVHEYPAIEGKSPTFDALADFEALSPGLRDMVRAGIERLGDKSKHTSTLVEKVEPGLWCMRVKYRRNYARLFFTFAHGTRIYLMNGYVKKTNKIPLRELKRARRLLIELQQRRLVYAKQ